MDINWKDGVTPISRLNLDNFYSFANLYAEHTYLLVYKATGDKLKTPPLCVNVLSHVICHESGVADSDSVLPEEGINRALRACLGKDQLARLYDDSQQVTNVDLPTPDVIDRIVDNAVDKADKEMPRYAPVFSGTVGSAVILAIVACIIAAITFVWINPFSKAADKSQDEHLTKTVQPAASINRDLLIEADSAVVLADENGNEFSGGFVPVTLSLDGPDTGDIASISVHSGDTPVDLYQYGKHSYCYFAASGSTYAADISDASGAAVSSYAYIPELPIPSSGDVSGASVLAVAHNQSATLTFAGDINVITPPEKCGYILDGASSVIVTPTGKEDSIGIDSITVSVGGGSVVVIPIIIYNNAPVIDSASLSQTLLHTPSRTGSAAGRIIASDADGDSIRFALADSEGCSALLTPNGSYMVRIDDDFSGDTASFSFTASDGRITSDPITVSFTLENHLIDIEKLSQRFVCYSGEDGFYTLDLPSVDDDGDPLTWEVISTLTDSVTPNGSQIILSDDRSVVKYRIDPSVNKDFTELIELVCTDGWLQSQTIQLTCNVSANKPPVAAAGNTATTTLADAMAVCSVRISDDCPFDKCVISGIEEVVGGTVTDGEGWDNLQFTFVPDGSEAECTVLVVVKDTLSGATSVIKYVIVVE